MSLNRIAAALEQIAAALQRRTKLEQIQAYLRTLPAGAVPNRDGCFCNRHQWDSYLSQLEPLVRRDPAYRKWIVQ